MYYKANNKSLITQLTRNDSLEETHSGNNMTTVFWIIYPIAGTVSYFILILIFDKVWGKDTNQVDDYSCGD